MIINEDSSPKIDKVKFNKDMLNHNKAWESLKKTSTICEYCGYNKWSPYTHIVTCKCN